MKRLFGLLAAVAVTACSTNEVEEAIHPMSGEHVVVSATIGDPSARVAMEDAGDYIKVDWKNGGESFVVANFHTEEYAVFTQTESTEDSPSLFEGTLPGTGLYLAVLPAAMHSTAAADKMVLYANQHGTLDESLCLMATLSDDGRSFHFQHATSLLRPTFKVGDTELANNQITRVALSSNTIYMMNSVFGFGQFPVYVAAECNALETIYLYLISEEIAAGDADRSFDVVVTTADAKIYTGQLTVPDGKTLLPGKFYTPTITLSEPTE